MSEELDPNKLAVEFINANLDRIAQPIFSGIKGTKAIVRSKLKTTYSAYLERILERHSKSKSFFVRSEAVPIYGFFVPPNLSNRQRQLSAPTAASLAAVAPATIVTGLGGCGKTMLMRHFLVSSILERTKTPVLVELRQLNNSDNSLQDTVLQTLKANGLDVDQKYMERAFKAGHFCLLLDGFDELLNQLREPLIQQIQRFHETYPKNWIFVSSGRSLRLSHSNRTKPHEFQRGIEMIGDPGGHRRTPLLPSAFLRPLSQGSMRMMKIVAHSSNPTEGIMPIRPTRKAQRFAPLSCVAHPIGQVEPLDGAGVGFRPTQVGHDLGQFALAKNRSDFHLLNPPSLPMFDHLGIYQALGDPHHRGRGSAAGASTRHRIGSTKGRYNRFGIGRFAIGKQRRQPRITGQPLCRVGHHLVNRVGRTAPRHQRYQQFALRIQAVGIPVIPGLTRVVLGGHVPLFFRHIRPFLIKLEGHWLQVANQPIMQLIANPAPHPKQPTHRILGHPYQTRRDIQTTATIQMLHYRDGLRFADFAVKQRRAFPLTEFLAAAPTAQITNPVHAIDLTHLQIGLAALAIGIALNIETTQIL